MGTCFSIGFTVGSDAAASSVGVSVDAAAFSNEPPSADPGTASAVSVAGSIACGGGGFGSGSEIGAGGTGLGAGLAMDRGFGGTGGACGFAMAELFDGDSTILATRDEVGGSKGCASRNSGTPKSANACNPMDAARAKIHPRRYVARRSDIASLRKQLNDPPHAIGPDPEGESSGPTPTSACPYADGAPRL